MAALTHVLLVHHFPSYKVGQFLKVSWEIFKNYVNRVARNAALPSPRAARGSVRASHEWLRKLVCWQLGAAGPEV